MTLAVAEPTRVRPAARRPVRRGWRPTDQRPFPSLGWGVLEFTYAFLPSPADEKQPFVFTDEQARRVVEMYRLDPETGSRVYRRVHVEEAKGWGKSPVGAAIALTELRGPVCFDGWDADGQPVGVPWGIRGRTPPWIQIAAVSEDQTQNTFGSLYWFLTADDHRAARDLKVDEGRTRLYLRDQPNAFLERVTASAGSREGQRLTHAVLDEPQLWTVANNGDRLARTILRNLAKTGGWAHFTGNAPVLGRETVAELLGEPTAGALHLAHRPSEIPRRDWSDDQKRAALVEVYGDAVWMTEQLDRLLVEVNDPAIPWSESLRYFFNTRTTDRADQWMPSDVWDATKGAVSLSAAIPTYAAVVVAHDHRLAAVAVAQRHGEKVPVRVTHFRAEDDDEYLDLDKVEKHLRSLRSSYPAIVLSPRKLAPNVPERLLPTQGPEIVYHGSFFEGPAQRLRRDGFALVDIPSSADRLAPAAETLMSLVTEQDLVHEDDPVLAAHVRDVVARPAPKGWYLDAEPGRPIVAAQAVMVAVHRAMTAPRPPQVATRPRRSAGF